MKPVKLSFLDRFAIIAALPQRGSYYEIVLIKDITAKVEFKQEEMKLMNFSGQSPSWQKEDEPEPKEVEFTEMEKDFLRKILQKLDEENTLTKDCFNIYEYFVK